MYIRIFLIIMEDNVWFRDPKDMPFVRCRSFFAKPSIKLCLNFPVFPSAYAAMSCVNEESVIKVNAIR